MKHVLGDERKVDEAEVPSVICILDDKEKKALEEAEMKNRGSLYQSQSLIEKIENLKKEIGAKSQIIDEYSGRLGNMTKEMDELKERSLEKSRQDNIIREQLEEKVGNLMNVVKEVTMKESMALNAAEECKNHVDKLKMERDSQASSIEELKNKVLEQTDLWRSEKEAVKSKDEELVSMRKDIDDLTALVEEADDKALAAIHLAEDRKLAFQMLNSELDEQKNKCVCLEDELMKVKNEAKSWQSEQYVDPRKTSNSLNNQTYSVVRNYRTNKIMQDKQTIIVLTKLSEYLLLADKIKSCKKAVAFGMWKQFASNKRSEGQIPHNVNTNISSLQDHTAWKAGGEYGITANNLNSCTRRNALHQRVPYFANNQGSLSEIPTLTDDQIKRLLKSLAITSFCKLLDKKVTSAISRNFRIWSCSTKASCAVETQAQIAEEMANQLENTREKLFVLKSHLGGVRDGPPLMKKSFRDVNSGWKHALSNSPTIKASQASFWDFSDTESDDSKDLDSKYISGL